MQKKKNSRNVVQPTKNCDVTKSILTLAESCINIINLIANKLAQVQNELFILILRQCTEHGIVSLAYTIVEPAYDIRYSGNTGRSSLDPHVVDLSRVVDAYIQFLESEIKTIEITLKDFFLQNPFTFCES